MNAEATISDRYITGKSPGQVSTAEDAQDSQVTQSSYSNGMMTVSFNRPVDTQVSDFLLLKYRFLSVREIRDCNTSTTWRHRRGAQCALALHP